MELTEDRVREIFHEEANARMGRVIPTEMPGMADLRIALERMTNERNMQAQYARDALARVTELENAPVVSNTMLGANLLQRDVYHQEQIKKLEGELEAMTISRGLFMDMATRQLEQLAKISGNEK